MTAPTRWWWVRHAPVLGAPHRIYGQKDASCDTGDEQSFRALAALLPTDAVWVISSLCRTRETAEAIAAAGMPMPEPLVEPDLAEQSFGEWEGLNWQEMEAADPDVYAAFWRDPTAVAVALDLIPEAAMAVVIDNLSVTRVDHVKDGLLRSRAGVWQVQGVNMPCRWIC